MAVNAEARGYRENKFPGGSQPQMGQLFITFPPGLSDHARGRDGRIAESRPLEGLQPNIFWPDRTVTLTNHTPS